MAMTVESDDNNHSQSVASPVRTADETGNQIKNKKNIWDEF
jgi:hypothetical protein